MRSENENLSYGDYLKQHRLEKNVSLETVSQNTKISKYILESLEQQKKDQLPADLYVKNFIRLFAREVDADEKEAVRLYTTESESRKDVFPGKPRKGLGKKLLWVLGILIGLAIGFYTVFISGDSSKEPKTQLPEPEAVLEASPPSAQTALPDIQNTAEAANPAKKWLLEIRAVEKTWMKVMVDGRSPLEYMLEADEEIRLEADREFDLMVANPGSLISTLNGRPVTFSGRSGQVVSLKIP